MAEQTTATTGKPFKKIEGEDLMVEREQEFPKDYWGVVEDVDYDPKFGDYKQPTIILSIKAYQPPYQKNQLIFLKVDNENQTFGADTANPVSLNTYTGVFFRVLMQSGVSIKSGDTVYNIARSLRDKHVHAVRKTPAELQEYLRGVKVKQPLKTQKDKLVIVAVQSMKPSTI